MKGIILAGGSGSRLYPLTLAISKQLLPIHDKPMIYYPLSILMLSGIKDILIISTPHDLPSYQKLLGDGSSFGIKISYAEQARPEGLAQAFIIGQHFLDGDSVALILGDNIIYGNALTDLLTKAINKKGRATIFGYFVNDPERFGVVQFNQNGEVLSIEEKPDKPKSNYAVIGLYYLDNRSVEFAKKVRPSSRGELEITEVLNMYLSAKSLDVELLGRGFAWLDSGTIKTLYEANEFIRIIEQRQNIKIAALEEIAFRHGWIGKTSLMRAAEKYGKSDYGNHLMNVAQGRLKDLNILPTSTLFKKNSSSKK